MATKRSGFVTVACKLPQGLLVPLPDGRTIKLNGRASAFNVAEHGMTQVPVEDWNAIQAMYSEAKWLTSEAVFALKDAESAADKAIERKDVDAGFDPIDPNNPNAGLAIGATIQREGGEDLGR
jgi:hypothetical protein